MREDGGPAFPTFHHEGAHEAPRLFSTGGLTLRDYFATQAMAAIIGKYPCSTDNTPDERPLVTVFHLELARGAYAYADAMLVERNK
jgi:hypothetical protein